MDASCNSFVKAFVKRGEYAAKSWPKKAGSKRVGGRFQHVLSPSDLSAFDSSVWRGDARGDVCVRVDAGFGA